MAIFLSGIILFLTHFAGKELLRGHEQWVFPDDLNIQKSGTTSTESSSTK